MGEFDFMYNSPEELEQEKRVVGEFESFQKSEKGIAAGEFDFMDEL